MGGGIRTLLRRCSCAVDMTAARWSTVPPRVPRSSAATVIGTTLVVRPDVATAQLGDEASSEETSGENGDGSTDDDSDQPAADDTLRRFYAVARLDPERYQRDFAKLAAEVIASLAGLVGTSVEISLEITATNADGFPEHVTRTVTENARTLKLDSYGFEDR